MMMMMNPTKSPTRRTRAAFALLVLGGGLATWSAARAVSQDERGVVALRAFMPPAPPSPEDVIMLQLRDGTVRFGAIDEHDRLGLDFIKLEDSGRVRIPWGFLDPTQSESLRTKFGYVQTEVEEALVEAERLLLHGGGVVEGVVVSREGQTYLVKTNGTMLQLPKERVRAIESNIQVPALDVYTREEMYARYAEQADMESAKSVLELARKSESILAFDKAIENYERAIALGIDVESKAEGALAAARVKAENQEQVEVLREAEQLRKRGDFDEALTILRTFPEQYEDSPLVEDSRQALVKMLDARERAAIELTHQRWNHWADKLTRAKARDATFEEARTWATEEASREIGRRVHEDLVAKISEEIQFEQVKPLWEARRRKGGWKSAGYGRTGTWLLGQDKAQAGGVEEEEPGAAPASELDAQRQAMEQRIKRYIENRRVAQRSASAQDAEDERQQFWESWGGKAKWLFAYYVEESGDYDIRPRPALRKCKTCGGLGAIEQILTGAVPKGDGSALLTCPTCRGVQVSRSIYYR